MQSFTLKTSTWTFEERLKLFKDLYVEVLEDDEYWHFFYEAEQGDFLRVSDEYIGATIDYLEQYDNITMYVHEGDWVETLPFVVNNLAYFRDMFHMNSVFALTYNGDMQYLLDNLFYWVDRYSHSLHDMLQLPFGGGVMERESHNISRATVARAWFDGYRFRYLEARKVAEEKNDGDESN